MVRDFRLLLTGSYVSMFGSRVTTIAYPLLALYLTGSSFTAGLVAFAANVPSVLAYMPAGALVDRWNPRQTMLLCESGRGIAIGLVALTLLVGKPNIILVLVAVFVEETLEVFSTLADQRCVRSLLPPERASSAQAQIEAGNHAVILAGRPFGAFLFSLKPMLPFLADALTFAVSVTSIINVKSRDAFHANTTNMPKLQLWKEISDGIEWLVKDKYARAAMVLSAGTTLIGQALLIVFLTEAHRALLSPVMMGLALAASGIGGLLGSAVAPWWARWWARCRPGQSPVSLILVQMLAWAGALSFLALVGAGHVALMALVMAAFSAAGALGNIEIATHLTQRVEYNMVARATSINRLIALSACAAGPMLGGILYQLSGAEGAVITLWLITSALAIGAWLTPSIHPGGEVAVKVRDAVLRAVQHWVTWLRRVPRVVGNWLAHSMYFGRRAAVVIRTWLPPTTPRRVTWLKPIVTTMRMVGAGTGPPSGSGRHRNRRPSADEAHHGVATSREPVELRPAESIEVFREEHRRAHGSRSRQRPGKPWLNPRRPTAQVPPGAGADIAETGFRVHEEAGV